jgi:hypothetical protein
MRFFAGLLVGLLSLAGYIGYNELHSSKEPCYGACGSGTRCEEDRCVPDRKSKRVKRGKRRRGSRRWRGRRRRSAPATEAQGLRQPTAADLEHVTRGPSLKQTDYVNLSSSSGSERELTTADVDKRIRAVDRRIVACIDEARDDYNVDEGRVVVSFRIERSGAVKRVRVAAPAVLQRNGIYRCIRSILRGLRFPRSGQSLIMSYPYKLH